MKLLVETLTSYATDCLQHAAPLDQAALKRLINGLKNHDRKVISSWAILKAVASTKLCKATQEVKLIFELLQSVGKAGLRERLEFKLGGYDWNLVQFEALNVLDFGQECIGCTN